MTRKELTAFPMLLSRKEGNIMKRWMTISVTFLLLITMLPLTAFASSDQNQISETTGEVMIQEIHYEDGSSLEIITSWNSTAQDRGTKTGTKVYNKRDASGALEWKATLTASFTYNGISATCTSASCSVSIYNSNWYTVSNSTVRSGNTATASLKMGYSVLGSTPIIYSYTITLSCDANGNLS